MSRSLTFFRCFQIYYGYNELKKWNIIYNGGGNMYFFETVVLVLYF